MKRILAVVAATVLAGCGSHDVRVSTSVDKLVKPGGSPWLSVAEGPSVVSVHGLDHKVTIEPTSNIAQALQSQLGEQLQPDYFSYLTVSCKQVAARINVDADNTPGVASIDVSMQCLIFARGYTSTHDYEAKPSVAIDAATGDAAFAKALPALLAMSARDMAGHLRDDIKRTNSHS